MIDAYPNELCLVYSLYSRLYLVQSLGVADAGRLGSGGLGQTRSIPGLHIVGQVILGYVRPWQVKS